MIFSDSNNLMKSVKLFLDALNVIRSFYVTEKARDPPSNTLKVCSLLQSVRVLVSN
jgi:ataxia telangiectasia mutated family protein